MNRDDTVVAGVKVGVLRVACLGRHVAAPPPCVQRP